MSLAAREVALACLGDDPRLAERLRAATWSGVTPTVFVDRDDERALRLATAAGAQIGSVAPDRSGVCVLVPDGVHAAGADNSPPAPTWVVAIDAPTPSVGRTVRLVDVHAGEPSDAGDDLAIVGWDDHVLDELAARGWRFGPVAPPRPGTPIRLDGLRVLHLTSVHRPDDGRIYHKEVAALRGAGADARVLGFDPRPGRRDRVAAGFRLVAEAERRAVDIVHIHDPELLPAIWRLRRRTGQTVIYDAHEYLGQTTRTKPWIPAALRVPTAVGVERAERALARGVDAVVAVTEDMALDFAERGIRAISVANFAPAARFPEPGAPEEGLVMYVGALDPSRGRDLMLQAFPMVDHPRARLLLAGPGQPGPLPPRVEHLGPADYAAVPGLLDRASVVWIPLRRTPNNDRGRLTKVMEAMASGRPLVTSNLTRTAAIVQQAGCGIVVPFDDPAAHAAAITDLLRDPARAAAMGAAGRRAFLSSMTFDREADRLVRLYAELTGRTMP